MSDRFLPIADDDGDDPDLIQDRAAPRVTRVEVLDHRRGAEPFGRVFSARDVGHVELSYQDGGRTLKIFLDGEVDQRPPSTLSDEERAERYAAIRADRLARGAPNEETKP